MGPLLAEALIASAKPAPSTTMPMGEGGRAARGVSQKLRAGSIEYRIRSVPPA